MSEDSQTERRKLIEERIQNVKLEGSYREHFVRLIEQLESDDEALIVLKGHLVIEERITAVIEKFVFHPEYLEKARLTFAQKVAIARSMSLDEARNSIWDLIEKIPKNKNGIFEAGVMPVPPLAFRALFADSCPCGCAVHYPDPLSVVKSF